MSDFGAIITFEKVEGTFNEEDKALIINEIANIIEAADYSEIIESGDYKTLYEWSESALCLRITEYYYDESADEIKQFAEEDDMEEVEQIAGKLKDKLGDQFTIEAIFIDW